MEIKILPTYSPNRPSKNIISPEVKSKTATIVENPAAMEGLSNFLTTIKAPNKKPSNDVLIPIKDATRRGTTEKLVNPFNQMDSILRNE